MLYSKQIERGNRFSVALKISFPFFILIVFWSYAFSKFDKIERDDIVLFTILSLCYAYYSFYLIYKSFDNTFIDQVTGVFTREKISAILREKLGDNHKIIVMIGIENISEIAQRYGLEKIDQIMAEFVNSLEIFLEKNGFKKIPIGKFADGFFLLCLQNRNDVSHVLKLFQLEIIKQGISNIEIRPVFSIANAASSLNLNGIISNLAYNILNKNGKIDTQTYDNQIRNAIKHNNFVFKFQTIKSLKSTPDMLYLISKLKFKDNNVPKNRFIQMINQMGLEIEYDLENLRALVNSGACELISNKVFIEISAVSIRNVYFKNELLNLIKISKIDPSKIVFEFYENNVFSDVVLFSEIIKEYEKLGFSFALSHFGGNNCSFEYLKYLDVDFIIFDLEFSKNLFDEKIKKVFEFSLNLAHQMQVKTLIRFIDKEEILEEISELDIDYAQGFLIDKPKNL